MELKTILFKTTFYTTVEHHSGSVLLGSQSLIFLFSLWVSAATQIQYFNCVIIKFC